MARFVRIGRNTEIVEADAEVEVIRIGRQLAVPDLVVIGSHCAGLDVIASALAREGLSVKLLAVGSQGGLAAARRRACETADPKTAVNATSIPRPLARTRGGIATKTKGSPSRRDIPTRMTAARLLASEDANSS